MGDGTWRLLALAIILGKCKDNVLLIDEIDTGLHYSVMRNMWKLVYEASKELGIQVFATTHSLDCVRSLAAICHHDISIGNDVTIQRIDAQNKESTPYNEEEIIFAANEDVEVR